MDKREEDFNDSSDISDISDSNELPEIPETLRGEPKNESEVAEAAEEKTVEVEKTEQIEQTEKNEKTGEIDQTDQTEETKQTDGTSAEDSEFENAVSELMEENEVSIETENADETKEQAQAEILNQKKGGKSGLIKRISIVAVIAIVLIGGGLFLFWQLGKVNNNYIMTINGEKVTLDELKLTMIFNIVFQQESDTPKQTAIDQLTDYMILDKAAKDKKIELPQEEKDYIKQYADYIKTDLANNNVKIPNVPEDRFELILGGIVSNNIYNQLVAQISQEKNFTVDEAAYASELANYKQTDKLLKYIIVSTPEEAEEVRNIISAGELSIDDIIKQYSIYYNESNGIQTVSLSQIGLPTDQNQKILALKASEYSDAIDLNGMYGVFVAVTDAETEKYYREQYTNYQQYLLFQTEYDTWKAAANIKMNDKAIANFDETAFTDKFWADVATATTEANEINTMDTTDPAAATTEAAPTT